MVADYLSDKKIKELHSNFEKVCMSSKIIYILILILEKYLT